MSDRLTKATINLSNYSHNIGELVELVPSGTRVMAVVKANAYGHGIEEISKAAIAAGATYLGVASLGELRRIRSADIHAPVLILNYIDAGSLTDAVQLDATVTIMDEALVENANEIAASQGETLKVHIKIDTGMHRAGCDPGRVVAIAKAVQSASHLELEGVFTHFAESEAEDQAFTDRQLKVFTQCIETLKQVAIEPRLIHCANSAATIARPDAHFTMVRPGIITYGLNPFSPEHELFHGVAENFKPVLSLSSEVIFIRDIMVGESVGYNRRWTADRPSKIALVPVGYGDGYRRSPHHASNMLINGQYAPIIGGIAMDQTVIDITDIEGEVSLGDEVVIFGTQNGKSWTVDDVAKQYGTINYEVVTALSDRIVRKYTH